MIFGWWAPSRLVFEPGSVDASKPALNAFISPCAYPVFLHIVMCASERAHNLAFGYLGCDCILFIPLLIFQLQQAKCALAMSNSDSYEKPSDVHYDASAAGAIKTTESPVIPSASRHPPNSLRLSPLTNSISLCFLTVRTRGSWSSSSSSAMYMVSSTSPRTRLQCESYA
jgi:hypothetical protein